MAELDVEVLIEAVKSRPIIWDCSHEDYKNRIKKRDAWAEVCAALFSEFQSKSDIEKNNIGKDVQTKWKSLRDRHIRYIRESKGIKSGSAAKPKKTYIYAKHLEFLRVTIAHNSTEDSERNDEEGGQDAQNEPEHDVETATPVRDEGTVISTATLHRRKKAKIEDMLEKYMQAMTRSHTVREVEDDEDLTFFRSLVPNVKKLPAGDKLQFKSDVLNLLITYNNKVHNQQFGPQQQYVPQQYYGAQHNYGPQQYHVPLQTNHQNLLTAQQPGGANHSVNNPGPSNAPNTLGFQSNFPGSSSFTVNVENDNNVLGSMQSPGSSGTSDSLMSLN